MKRFFLLMGSLFGFTGVLFGAFGAHALRQRLPVEMLNIFETAVRYQFYHALALLICAVLLHQHSSRLIRWAGLFFVSGTFIFSGSLYILALTGITAFGAITPIGGLCFMIGWGCLFVSAYTLR